MCELGEGSRPPSKLPGGRTRSSRPFADRVARKVPDGGNLSDRSALEAADAARGCVCSIMSRRGSPARGAPRGLNGRWRAGCRAALWGSTVCPPFSGLSGCAWRVMPPERVADPVPCFSFRVWTPYPAGPTGWDFRLFRVWLRRMEFLRSRKGGGLLRVAGHHGASGEGALSRRKLPYTLTESEFARAAGSSRSARLLVERSLAASLFGELESRWRSNSSSVRGSRVGQHTGLPRSERPIICSAIQTTPWQNGSSV